MLGDRWTHGLTVAKNGAAVAQFYLILGANG
jgi:hypothetical protein